MAIDGFGGPDKLRMVDLPRPKPGPHELLIRTVAAGVNPVDCRIRQGRPPSDLPHAFPLIPGFDVAGVVDEIGERTSRFRKGDRVWAYAPRPIVQWGCYAEFVAVEESSVALMPTKLLYEEAAAVPLAALAAWQALFDEGGISSGSSVLIHSGAGGVGHFAVQLAKNAGCSIHATAGAANQTFLRELGADVVIDYAKEDFRDVVRRNLPEGIDLVINTVDVQTAAFSLEIIRRGGRLVSTVGLPGAEETSGAGVHSCELSVRPSAERLGTLKTLVDRGKLRPHVMKIFSLAEAPEAQRVIEQRHVRGKLVLNL
jgi:NADPH:quinone reductase-like Zn-dependent oxidoreductase